MPAASSTQRCAAVAEPTRSGTASERERRCAAASAKPEVEKAQPWRPVGNAASDFEATRKPDDKVPHFPATLRGGYEEILQVELHSGSPINLVSESAAEACGLDIVVDDFGYDDYIDCDESFTLPSCIVGLTSFRLVHSASGYEMWFDGFVVEDGYMNAAVAAGAPFMEHNDLSIRPSKHKIMFGDELVFTYTDLPLNLGCVDPPVHTVISDDVHVVKTETKCECVCEPTFGHTVYGQCDILVQMNETPTSIASACECEHTHEPESMESDRHGNQISKPTVSAQKCKEYETQHDECVGDQPCDDCKWFLESKMEKESDNGGQSEVCQSARRECFPENERENECGISTQTKVYVGDSLSFDHADRDDWLDGCLVTHTSRSSGILTTSCIGYEVDCPTATPVTEPNSAFPCTEVSSVAMVTEHSSECDSRGIGAAPSSSEHSMCSGLVSMNSFGSSLDECTHTTCKSLVIDPTCDTSITEPSCDPPVCTECSSGTPVISAEPRSRNPIDYTLMGLHPSPESASLATVGETFPSLYPRNATPPDDHQKWPIISPDGETPGVPHNSDCVAISPPLHHNAYRDMAAFSYQCRSALDRSDQLSALVVAGEPRDPVHQLDCRTPSPDVCPSTSQTAVSVLAADQLRTPNADDDTLGLHLSLDSADPACFDASPTWSSFPWTFGHRLPSIPVEGGPSCRPLDGALHLASWMMTTKRHPVHQPPTSDITDWLTVDVNCSPVPWIAHPPAPPACTGLAVPYHPPLSPVTPG